MIRSIFKLLRVKHYIKNLLIFLPIFFTPQAFGRTDWFQFLASFVAFCLLTSIVYIVNDSRDIDKDRQHEVKRLRPLASGAISLGQARVVAMILAVLCILLTMVSDMPNAAIVIMLAYLLINIGYSAGLKNIPLIDVSIIVAGFMLRVFYGGAVASLAISNWMYLTILSITFFMALGKRRNELTKVGETARLVLKHYSIDFLDKAMYLCLSMSVVFYAMWTVAHEAAKNGQDRLVYTVPIVLLILLKYSMLIEGDSHGDPADVILSSKTLLGLILFYVLAMVALLYF
jgi:4-hydroxybenzoate polyprenyltransferase